MTHMASQHAEISKANQSRGRLWTFVLFADAVVLPPKAARQTKFTVNLKDDARVCKSAAKQRRRGRANNSQRIGATLPEMRRALARKRPHSGRARRSCSSRRCVLCVYTVQARGCARLLPGGTATPRPGRRSKGSQFRDGCSFVSG